MTDVREYVIIKSGRAAARQSAELNPEHGLDRQLCKLNWLHDTSTWENYTSYGPGDHRLCINARLKLVSITLIPYTYRDKYTSIDNVL